MRPPHRSHTKLAAPGYIFLRTNSLATGELFVRPSEQHLFQIDGASGKLQYFSVNEAASPAKVVRPLGEFGLFQASVTPLDGAAALQIKVEGGHVAHIDAADDTERDRWCLEINLASLRAASGQLRTASSHAANPPSAPASIAPLPNVNRPVPEPTTPPAAAHLAPPPPSLPPPSLPAPAPLPPPRPAAVPVSDAIAAPPSASKSSFSPSLARTWAEEEDERPLASTPPPSNWAAVGSFVEGASVFAISRMWSDLVAAFVFGLHAIPFCGGFLDTPCTPTAPSDRLFLYAIGCVPLAALAKHLSESRFAHHPFAKLVPTIMGYVAGWAFGNAFVALLSEISAAAPGLCAGEAGCTMLNLTFSLAFTVGAHARARLNAHTPYTRVTHGHARATHTHARHVRTRDTCARALHALSILPMPP